VANVAANAVNTVMSGPASGVIAASYTAEDAGFANVITYDMGGTSCDVGLVRDGLPVVSSELELEYGVPIHVPMVDVHTIGAGGGSLLTVNEAGLLQVGPESAGAEPGPICFGRGGEAVTVTDANLLLGRLNPEGLLSVDGAVSVARIEQAFAEQLGRPLGVTPFEAAEAAIRIANDRMAGALRMVSLSRGHDPRDFALLAFGGAGPLHAADLAAELGVPTVIVPARPGITNALGCLVADLRHDFVHTINRPLNGLDIAEVHAQLAKQVAEGTRLIEREPVDVERLQAIHSVDMQFQGQSHILTLPLAHAKPTLDDLRRGFEAAYWTRFEVELPELRPVLVNVNTAVIGRRGRIEPAALSSANRSESAAKVRAVHFNDGWISTPVIPREALAPGAVIDGPTIIEQLDTTVVLPPSASGRIDSSGNLLIEVPDAAGEIVTP